MSTETLSKDSLAALYAGAYQLYRNGKYQEAVHMFRFLTMREPMTKKNWMGLGASYQMMNEHDRAIQSYACATKLDETDPKPHMHAAECFFSKKEGRLAEDALLHAERLAKSHEDSEKLFTRLALIRKTCSNVPKIKREGTHG